MDMYHQDDEVQILVEVHGPRPDFRTVISFLWSDFHNVDSDGNSFDPASREWTMLYLCSREFDDESVTVEPASEEPLRLQVSSSTPYFAKAVAYFIAVWTSGKLLDVTGLVEYDASDVAKDLEMAFAITNRMDRARNSIWNDSTTNRPFPNLEARSGVSKHII